MNYRMVARISALALLIFAALMLLPMVTALAFGESVHGFAAAMAVTAAAGLALLGVKPRSRTIYAREGFAAVSMAWILMGLFGAIPFVVSGDIPRYADAVFETVSGLTTTGASVVSNVDTLSRAGLFWRSFLEWLGGMGVLIFIMAVLPMGGEHSMHIMRAELPGPTVGKFVPRAGDTARILYIIYAALTVAETVLLMLGGMSFYEALLHAFATAGTGGFSTRNASLAAFDSAYIEMVISVFLLLFGVNFNLYYLAFAGRVRDALKSEELHCYLGILLVSTVSITLGITKIYSGVREALRHAFTNSVSLMSTAAFATVDTMTWPAYTRVILVLLMFIGGCAGSTSGGLKVSRVLLLFKTAGTDIARILHPREVRRVEMDGKRVDAATTKAVYCYFWLYFVILMLTTFIISLDGHDFTTNLTAALSCISNIGPSLSLVSETQSYLMFSPLSRAVMMVVMLLGRLEIYPLFILLSPTMWKRE